MSFLDRFARRWLRREREQPHVHQITTLRDVLAPHKAKAARRRHARNKVARASRKRNRSRR